MRKTGNKRGEREGKEMKKWVGMRRNDNVKRREKGEEGGGE